MHFVGSQRPMETNDALCASLVSIGRWEPTKCILHFVGEEEQRND